jgi:hypothetical protein
MHRVTSHLVVRPDVVEIDGSLNLGKRVARAAESFGRPTIGVVERASICLDQFIPTNLYRIELLIAQRLLT